MSIEPINGSSLETIDPLSNFSHISKGVGEIPDTLSPGLPGPPPFLVRAALSVGIVCLHALLSAFHLACWIYDLFFGEPEEKSIYLALHDLSHSQDLAVAHMQKLHRAATDPIAHFWIGELLAIEELHPHLGELLRGANVRLEKDQGHFFRKWAEHSESYPRISSHHYQEPHCRALGHVLFYLDLQGHTRMQFENSPLLGVRGWIYHTLDYLYYCHDNQQIGVAGISPHTDAFHLNIQVKLSH
jgi:hypothetical protein